jgi:hypothetical protein
MGGNLRSPRAALSLSHRSGRWTWAWGLPGSTSRRSALVDYVLAAETRGGGPLTMGDALAELLPDITEAADTIGTLLQTTNGRAL